jgi:hypothetical protein
MKTLLIILLLCIVGYAVLRLLPVSLMETRNGQTTMIESIQDLCQLLSEESLTITAVANHLGTIVEQGGGSVPMVVRPSDTAFREARIMSKPNSSEPSDVTLTLGDEDALTLGDLRAAFGNYNNVPRMRPGQAYRVMYYTAIPDQPFTCAISASIKAGQTVADSSTVASLSIRRDIRLDG